MYICVENSINMNIQNIPLIKHTTSGNFFLLAGPCAIEGEEMAFKIAEKLVSISNKLEIPLVFKGSFKKANRSRIDSFSGIKVEVEKLVVVEKEATKTASNPNQLLRDRLFGAGKIGEDMNFSWVTKNNIVPVYQKFYDAYQANKKGFSREDFDEIKLMYEALDAHKNTVEKQGLTADDNAKIAGIKVKFSPMFKIDRIGAKSKENESAKQ